MPDSARDWWSDFTSAWSAGGLGTTAANPTGWGVLSIASVLWLGRMGLGLTVLVVGLVLLGIWGAWRLATVFPSNRARIAALVVYAAMPLVPGVISTGRLSALVAYAIVPWFVHLLRTAAGIGTADPSAEAIDLVEGVLDLRVRERVRRTAVLVLATAVAVALAPAVLPVLAVVAVILGLTTLAVSAGVRTAAWLTGLGLVACAAAFVLNLPWATTWSWDDLVAPSLAGAPGRGLVDVASMAIGRSRFEVLALALYVPVLVALLVARAWRLTWAARAAGLVIVFLRAGDPPGPRRAAVPGPRDRRPAGARRARPGAVGGRVRRRVRAGRRRAHVRVASAARPARDRGRRARARAGAVRRHGRRVVRPALDADRGRASAAPGRHRARGRRQPAGR